MTNPKTELLFQWVDFLSCLILNAWQQFIEVHCTLEEILKTKQTKKDNLLRESFTSYGDKDRERDVFTGSISCLL